MASWCVLRRPEQLSFLMSPRCAAAAQKQICESFLPPHTISVGCTLAQHDCGKQQTKKSKREKWELNTCS